MHKPSHVFLVTCSYKLLSSVLSESLVVLFQTATVLVRAMTRDNIHGHSVGLLLGDTVHGSRSNTVD